MDIDIRNRIVDERVVRAGDLRADARNFRGHGSDQIAALTEMVKRVGFARPVLVRETPEGLTLVDGHLRASLDPEAMIPVIVVDLTDEEAGWVLASHDAIGALASANEAKFQSLTASLDDRVSTAIASVAPQRVQSTGGSDASAAARREVCVGETIALGKSKLAVAPPSNTLALSTLFGDAPVDSILCRPPAFGDHTSWGYSQILRESLIAAQVVAPEIRILYWLLPWQAYNIAAGVAEAAGFQHRQMVVWDTGVNRPGRLFLRRHMTLLCATRPKVSWPSRWDAAANVIADPLGEAMDEAAMWSAVLSNTPFIKYAYCPFPNADAAVIRACESARRVCFAVEPSTDDAASAVASYESAYGGATLAQN